MLAEGKGTGQEEEVVGCGVGRRSKSRQTWNAIGAVEWQ